METLSSGWSNDFSCVVGLPVFSGAFSQPDFYFFPADKVDEHVGRQWEKMGGLRVIQAGPAQRDWRDFQNCRDSWVEGDLLDKPQNP